MLHDEIGAPTQWLDVFSDLVQSGRLTSAIALCQLAPNALSPGTIWPVLLTHAPARPVFPAWESAPKSPSRDTAAGVMERWWLELFQVCPPPRQAHWTARMDDQVVTCSGSPLARAIELGYTPVVKAWQKKAITLIQDGQKTDWVAWAVCHQRWSELEVLNKGGRSWPRAGAAWQALQPPVPARFALPRLAAMGELPTDLIQWKAIPSFKSIARRPATAVWAKNMRAAIEFELAPADSGDLPEEVRQLFESALSGKSLTSTQRDQVLGLVPERMFSLRHAVQQGGLQGVWSLPAALAWSALVQSTSGALMDRWWSDYEKDLKATPALTQLGNEVIASQTIAGQPSVLTAGGLWRLRAMSQSTLRPPARDAQPLWPALWGEPDVWSSTMSALRHWLVFQSRRPAQVMEGYWNQWSPQGSSTFSSNHFHKVFHETPISQRLEEMLSLVRLGQVPDRWSVTVTLFAQLPTVTSLVPRSLQGLRDSLVGTVVQKQSNQWGYASAQKAAGLDTTTGKLLGEVMRLSRLPEMTPMSDHWVDRLAHADHIESLEVVQEIHALNRQSLLAKQPTTPAAPVVSRSRPRS